MTFNKQVGVDYSNYREWTEVELRTKSEYLGKYEEYTPDRIFSIGNKLISTAKAEGLVGCFLKFESTMDPYDDMTGPVCLTVCGYRKLNEKERKKQEELDYVKALSDSTGVTPYDIKNFLALKKSEDLLKLMKEIKFGEDQSI